MLAEVYAASATGEDTPIADIGCGTGLVAEALMQTDAISPQQHTQLESVIDGIDISPEMLAAAADKKLYRDLLQIDLTSTDEQRKLARGYGAVVSAGTFTFGHLGPEILRDLLTIGQTNTLYCIGVNSEYYERQGFADALESMHKDKLITRPVPHVRQMYNSPDNDPNTHANDTATVLVYRQR